MIKYTQRLEHNVKLSPNDKFYKDYYTFILEPIPTITYCGKVEKHWTTKTGRELFAIRDNDFFITIVSFSHDYICGIGNCGYDYCFDINDIPELIKKLEKEYNIDLEYPENNRREQNV